MLHHHHPVSEAPFTDVVAFVNPDSTRYEKNDFSVRQASAALAGIEKPTIITDFVKPNHFLDRDPESKTLYIVRGGDSTIGGAVDAAIRASQQAGGNPKSIFSTLFPHGTDDRFLFLGGGNANNISRSLKTDKIGHHDTLSKFYPNFMRPLLWSLYSNSEELLASGSATSCFGIGLAAEASERIQEVKDKIKQEFGQTSREPYQLTRYARELWASTIAAVTIPQLAGSVALFENGNEIDSFALERTIGLELIGSEKYAKTGNTRAAITSTNWQIITPTMPRSWFSRLPFIPALAARMLTGLHPKNLTDMSNKSIIIHPKLGNGASAKVHADGDILFELESDQFMTLRLASAGIPVLAKKSY